MKARREAAAGDDGVAPPNGWFERAADWLDGRAPKVGRNNNPDHLASWEDAAGDADDGSASWESLTAVGAGSASTRSDGGVRASAGEEEEEDEDEKVGDAEATDDRSSNEASPIEENSQSPPPPRAKAAPAKMERAPLKSGTPPPNPTPKPGASRIRRGRPDPLADKNRKPDFVIRMGGGGDGDGDDDDAETARRVERSGGGDRGHTVPGDDDGVGGDGGRAYQREKKRGRGGFDDRVAKMTRDDPPARAKAKAAAEDAKSRERTRSGRVADVHTNITVLYPETFDEMTALARRPSDGIGLNRDHAGVGGRRASLDGEVGGAGAREKKKRGDGVFGVFGGGGDADDPREKRRWLVAFCTRWAPPCNLLVREFALLGSHESLRNESFALGWVDCTPAKTTTFCGGRFGATGYPLIALFAGGRMARYVAVDRERIAGAIAPWALDTAREIDAHVPNVGGRAVGEEVPSDAPSRRAPTTGARGARASWESEHDALTRERDRLKKKHEKEEERRVAAEERRKRRDAAEAKKGREGPGPGSGPGERRGGSGARERARGETLTTAPTMSSRRRARMMANGEL